MVSSEIDRVERRIHLVLGMTVALIPIVLAMLVVSVVVLTRAM